jgi:hypothetical protein
MTLYVRQNGVYQQVDRPFVRVNGVYVGCQQAFVRTAGVYQEVWRFDMTPPDPPEISTELIETRNANNVLTGRYIKVGVRLPGLANDPTARLTRVLTNYPGSSETPPTTQFGGTFTNTPDSSYPTEPWSEWRYNNYGPHNDTSLFRYKQWTPNATTTTDIVNDKTYWFVGWSLDAAGNWSAPTKVSLHVPKASKDTPNIIVKEARFQANTAGTWTSGSAGFASGKLVQGINPTRRGLWFYGSQLSQSIGSQGTPTIRSAQIYIKRENDSGAANANVYLFWTGYPTVASLPAPGAGLDTNEMTKIGTLAKGQGGWFDLPASFWNNLNTGIKGMGLNYKDPNKAGAQANDYSVMQKLGDNIRCGEIHVTWEEQP